MIEIRDENCENCAKFSHCNNNDLVCIKKFQQLKVTLDEIENICKTTICDYPMNKVEEIMELINEVKEK